MPEHFDIPVLLLVFNRPETTKKVYAAIEKARPTKLYVAADGPRTGVLTDTALCKLTRAGINPNWPCEVKTRFRDMNLGGKKAIIDGINWFFDHEEWGIILEDDCVPSQEFFEFARQMLLHYKDDTRVMHVSGTNLQFGRKRGDASYYFSRIASVWGWATWKRAWKMNDPDMGLFNEAVQQNVFLNAFHHPSVADYIQHGLSLTHRGEINTWDFPYGFSMLVNNGLAVVPNANLVTNLGFNQHATRTTDKDNIHSAIPIGELGPLIHRPVGLPDAEADLFHLGMSVYDIKKSELTKLP